MDFYWYIIIKDDQQVQTVKTHWTLYGSLSKEVRNPKKRTGLSMGCHREMTNDQI